MSSVARTTGQTIISVLGTINTIASRTSQAVNTTAAGLDMLDSYVQKARTKQIASDAIEMSTYVDRLHKNSAMEQAKLDLELARELKSNSELATLYSENINKLKPIIDNLKVI
jgi:hypothetical protein